MTTFSDTRRDAWLTAQEQAATELFLFSQTASKTVANKDTETTLVSTGIGAASIAASRLAAGSRIRVTALGYLSDDVAPPALTIRVKLGGSTILSTGVVTLQGTLSNNVWRMEADLVCRTTGATGTVIGQGRFQFDNSTHDGYTEGMAMAAAATVNTTAALAVDVTATWDTAAVTNTITCSNLYLEVHG